MSHTESEKVMPVLEHIRELRNSLLVCVCAFIICFAVSFAFSNKIIAVFIRQFKNISSVVDTTLVVTSIAEGFLAQLKIACIAGFILSLPVHVFEIIKFIFPALTGRERRIVMSFLVFSLFLIAGGSYLAYFKIVPLVIRFLTSPGFLPTDVGFLLNYQTNMFYVFTFILQAVLALQTPLIMEILLVMNILKRRQLLKASRYIIVLIFVFSAIITPPDFISQLGVALPLVFFYFLAILVAKIFKFGED